MLSSPVLKARTLLDELIGEASCYVHLANSHTCRVHLHVLAALNVVERQRVRHAVEVGVVYCVPVKDDHHLKKTALFLSRPNDERGARWKPVELARFTREELELQQLDAAEFYLEARSEAFRRGLKQLPRLSFTRNLPFLKPDVVLWRAFQAILTLRSLVLALWAALAMRFARRSPESKMAVIEKRIKRSRKVRGRRSCHLARAPPALWGHAVHHRCR